MDQLRIFIETAFFHNAENILGRDPEDCFKRFSDLGERNFVDSARQHEFIHSDDSLKLIYRSWRDIWSIDPDNAGKPSLTNALIYASRRFLRMNQGIDNDFPCVDFRELFRWREFTRLLGEDIYVCAYLAWRDRDLYDRDHENALTRPLSFAPSLPNDNPDIRYMKTNGLLQELHCHLGASAKVLDINWISLMNDPSRREQSFLNLVRIHDSEDCVRTAAELYEVTAVAAALRFHLYRMLCSQTDANTARSNILSFCRGFFPDRFSKLTNIIAAYKNLEYGFRKNFSIDYITDKRASVADINGFAVYTGERRFLYLAFRYALRSGDCEFQNWLIYYILAKSLLRKYMVQLNTNHGFSNFQRYQDTKSLFLHGRYDMLPARMPIPDAYRDSGISYQEVRIAPKTDFHLMQSGLKAIRKAIDNELSNMKSAGYRIPKYSFIYHFIKMPDHKPKMRFGSISAVDERNHNVRSLLRTQCRNILRLAAVPSNKITGIDAASSEFNCRPEVFGQAFRYLKNKGLKATFHAGEDFYDIADGIRAIDEAITYLQLDSGDRIGHAMAMGINAHDYYAHRNNRLSIPAQWMLDNIVWLYSRAKDWNITVQPNIERFLLKNFKILFNEIYVEGESGFSLSDTDIETYHQSMLLRGDNPAVYNRPDNYSGILPHGRNEWDYYACVGSESTRIAAADRRAVNIYRNYHFNGEVRRRGEIVKEFHICPGYADLITLMQEKMMERVDRHGLCVECCPSSNLLIGSLEKFEKHPIFRFHDINAIKGHHLAVTINTDDLGVFQTSLANEYSYLALSNQKRKTPDGKNIYSRHEISEWLDRIAKMAEKYSFCK